MTTKFIQPNMNLSGDTGIHLESGDIAFKTGGTTKMTLKSDGKIGIGIDNPAIKLAVGDADTGINQESDGVLTIYTNANERMRFTDTGIVGIGTNTPSKAKLEIKGIVTTNLTARFYNVLGNNGSMTYNRDLSIYVDNQLACSELQVFSDERIKTNIQEVEDSSALQKVRDINCVSYNYKDIVSRGNTRVVGFLAQQVKVHLPEAVNEITDFIPNEMRVLDDISWNGTNMNSISLNSVSGVKYRFYVSNEADANDEVMKEVIGNEDNTFTFEQQWTNVFCYGKEVEDFHILDKQKLFALNFSATQELDRQLQAEKTKTAALETQVADLLARVSALESG
jgi:hypothetical protein